VIAHYHGVIADHEVTGRDHELRTVDRERKVENDALQSADPLVLERLGHA
jgi:hypothetical protein